MGDCWQTVCNTLFATTWSKSDIWWKLPWTMMFFISLPFILWSFLPSRNFHYFLYSLLFVSFQCFSHSSLNTFVICIFYWNILLLFDSFPLCLVWSFIIASWLFFKLLVLKVSQFVSLFTCFSFILFGSGVCDRFFMFCSCFSLFVSCLSFIGSCFFHYLWFLCIIVCFCFSVLFSGPFIEVTLWVGTFIEVTLWVGHFIEVSLSTGPLKEVTVFSAWRGLCCILCFCSNDFLVSDLFALRGIVLQFNEMTVIISPKRSFKFLNKRPMGHMSHLNNSFL